MIDSAETEIPTPAASTVKAGFSLSIGKFIGARQLLGFMRCAGTSKSSPPALLQRLEAENGQQPEQGTPPNFSSDDARLLSEGSATKTPSFIRLAANIGTSRRSLRTAPNSHMLKARYSYVQVQPRLETALTRKRQTHGQHGRAQQKLADS